MQQTLNIFILTENMYRLCQSLIEKEVKSDK